jgi:hypothetical protein
MRRAIVSNLAECNPLAPKVQIQVGDLEQALALLAAVVVLLPVSASTCLSVIHTAVSQLSRGAI